MVSIRQRRPRAFRVRAFAAALLTAMAAHANAAVTVLIDGAAYPAQLRENTPLLTRAHVARSASAHHYEGELSGIEKSWVRVSNIRGRWDGVVTLDGQHYVITGGRSDHGNIALDAQSPTDLMAGGRCATDASAAETQSLAAQLSGPVAEANLATLCTTTVDGVCLLAELDLAFDLLYQQTLGANAQAQAVAMLNVVDGYYTNDFNIAFDALSMTFLTNDFFSTTTDPNALLTDVTTKKDSGQVAFVTNRRAILHLVTGRNLDGSIVGISDVGSLCSATGNTGLSQIVTSGGLPSVGLTALVMAHELGHNFGAVHDGVGNTCQASGFIMSATLSPSATHFSSCSITKMTATINALPTPNACFEFPVDASVTARAGNPTNVNANESFTLDYDVAEAHASVPSTTITLGGSFNGAGGTFVAATMNGNACTVATNGSTYTCTTDANGGLLEATVQVAAATNVTVVATATVAATGDVKDIDSANDTSNQTVTTSTPPPAPTGLTATPGTAEIDLAWQDNSANETGFRIERRTGSAAFAQIATTGADVTTYADITAAAGVMYDYRVAAFGSGGTSTPASASARIATATSSGGGGGGGGGAFGAELAPLLLGLLALRRRSASVR